MLGPRDEVDAAQFLTCPSKLTHGSGLGPNANALSNAYQPDPIPSSFSNTHTPRVIRDDKRRNNIELGESNTFITLNS